MGGSEASGTAGQVENGRGGGRFDQVPAGGRTAETDHRDEEGHVGSSRGASSRFPQYRDQGIGVAAAIPGVPEDREVRGFDLEGYRASDGAVQFVR